MMRSLLVAVCLAAAIAPVSARQEPTIDDRFASADPSVRAWAAYVAGERRSRDLAPALVELLGDEGDDAHFVRAAALDALIQLQAKVPYEALEPVRDEFPEQVLILMVRDPDAHRVELLDVARSTTSDVEWLAACNALVERRAEGIAEVLLGELTISATVVVVASEDAGNGGGWGPGSSAGCGGGGGPRVPEGFPPYAEYRFSLEQRPGNVVLAPGPATVYYSRLVVAEGGSFGGPRRGGHEDRHERRVEYIRELLGSARYEIKLEAYPTYTVVWTDAEALRDEVARIDAELKRTMRRVARQLGVGVEPHVEVEVEDRRAPLAQEN